MNICKALNLVIVVSLSSLPLMIGIKHDYAGLGLIGTVFIFVIFALDFEDDKKYYNDC